MKEIFDYPEVHTFVGVVLTALVAWVKRKIDLKKINKKHREDLQDLRDTLATRYSEDGKV